MILRLKMLNSHCISVCAQIVTENNFIEETSHERLDYYKSIYFWPYYKRNVHDE